MTEKTCTNCGWRKKIPKQKPHRGECTHPIPAYLDGGQEALRFEIPTGKGFVDCSCWKPVAPGPFGEPVDNPTGPQANVPSLRQPEAQQ